MGAVIGIDLGTSFSAVAALDESGRASIVHNSDGQNVTPSCVMIQGAQVIVGEEARQQWSVVPAQVAARFKRDMGREAEYMLDGKSYSPTDLSAIVLERLKIDTEKAIGPISHAVVTIPANFTHEARTATLAAASTAGLEVRYLINEPTAAALFYAHKLGAILSGGYVVYDLGGGTFDVSIIQAQGQDIQVVTSQGVTRLGGDDFDQAIIDLVSRKYQVQCGYPLPPGMFSKNDAEDCKKSLSRLDKVVARVGQSSVEITRQEFQSEISPLIAQTEMLCESALDEVGLSPAQIRGVFLVGGSCRVPEIRASVRRVFGQEPTGSANLDEVVALGAAFYAAFRSDANYLSAEQKYAVSNIRFGEVTNFCFGTTIATPDSGLNSLVLRNEVLIQKNAKIPCRVQKTFYTTRQDQTQVNCDVTQSVSAETDPRFVKTLWKGSLPVPVGRPAGQPIHVSFGFDENNVMSCKFVDAGTGKDIAIDLKPGNEKPSGGFVVE